ncbi:MerR family transcriptional regulator [Fictibacillus sp. NRS-1165]
MLHHYDKIGLFSPSKYSDSGHRLYTESDIVRLQQIMSLK